MGFQASCLSASQLAGTAQKWKQICRPVQKRRPAPSREATSAKQEACNNSTKLQRRSSIAQEGHLGGKEGNVGVEAGAGDDGPAGRAHHKDQRLPTDGHLPHAQSAVSNQQATGLCSKIHAQRNNNGLQNLENM